MKKLVLSLALITTAASALAVSQYDLAIQKVAANGFTFVTDFITTDKTGALQMLVFGPDGNGGYATSQRKFGTSIVCDTTTCDVPVTTGPAGPNGIQGLPGVAGTNGTNGTDATAKAVVGTTVKTSVFRTYKSVTVASGTAIFYLTDDGTSTGNALYTEVFTDSVQVIVSDATASYQMSWAFTNSNKTLTVTTNKLTTANILTGLLGQAQANGAVVKLVVEGR